jgi:hypothetical protein
MNKDIKWLSGVDKNVKPIVDEFVSEFSFLEDSPYVMFDEKSLSHYICCHLTSSAIRDRVDFDATIYEDDPEEDASLYKLNRDITENQYAFTVMVADAKLGRSFEDIVVEYDKAYNPSIPLKIYGGQHRVKAIISSSSEDVYHGFRIYFGLTKEQKVEIATINNTSIAVSNDLIDRMKEQLLGSDLRDYFQLIGLLDESQDFSDTKSSDIPTVRVARTFVLNYWVGRTALKNSYHQPVVCKSGGMDSDYEKIRSTINWNDSDFISAGRAFFDLNRAQRSKVLSRKKDKSNQFASKVLSLAVVASWSYAAGLYQKEPSSLDILFGLTKNLGIEEDPLGAKGLSEARMKGLDPDTYRGLGARISSDELGRMLEVFIVLITKSTDKKITKVLANAAIQSFEAKKATYKANLSLARI